MTAARQATPRIGSALFRAIRGVIEDVELRAVPLGVPIEGDHRVGFDGGGGLDEAGLVREAARTKALRVGGGAHDVMATVVAGEGHAADELLVACRIVRGTHRAPRFVAWAVDVDGHV